MKHTTAPDRMTSLLSSWDGTSRVWTPTKETGYNPKYITGELLRIEEWETENGPARVAVILDDSDAQETAIFTSSTTLDKQWEQQCPSEGDRIGVAYGGQDKGQSGRVYNRYKLMVERTVFKREPCAVAKGDTGDLFADQ